MDSFSQSQTSAIQGLSAPRLPRLIAITDTRTYGVQATIEAATRLCRTAASQSVVIQLRERELETHVALQLGEELLKICEANGQALAVNDRLELATSLGTAWFHRKPTSRTAAQIRLALAPRVGSTYLTQGWHPADEPLPSEVDALLISPAVAPRKGRSALGMVALAEAVARASPVPVFALGGVGPSEIAMVLSTGVAGVAVQAAWYSDPEALLAALGIERSASESQRSGADG